MVQAEAQREAATIRDLVVNQIHGPTHGVVVMLQIPTNAHGLHLRS